MYEAWTHPATIAAVSRVIGVPVKINVQQEIGHTNVQLGEKGLDGLAEIPAEPIVPVDNGKAIEEEDITEDKDTDVIEWHNDMYPWSLVVSLTLPQGKGGETAVLCGDGSIIKAPKPDVVSWVSITTHSISATDHFDQGVWRPPARKRCETQGCPRCRSSGADYDGLQLLARRSIASR